MTLWLPNDLHSLLEKESLIKGECRTKIIKEILYKYFNRENSDVH